MEARESLAVPHGGGYMEQLIKYFIEQSNRTISEIRSEMHAMNEKLLDLQKFKAEMMISSKWVSFIVSGVTGVIMLLISVALNYKIKN